MAFKFDHAAFSPNLVARDLTGVMQLQPARIAVNNIGGGIAGGRLGGELTFHRDADGFAAQGRIELAGADAAKLLGSNAKAVDGLVTLYLQGDSTGLSPEGLIGALHGSGSIALADVHFAGIDAGAFDTAIRTADQSGSVDAAKVRAAVAAAMDRGRLAVLKGSADLTMAGEQIRVANATLQLQDGAELLLSGSLDFGKGAVDARMTLAGRPAANPLAGAKPEYSVTLKGPLAAPERTVDVSSLLGWLTLRSTELQTRRLQSLEANGRPDVSGPWCAPARRPSASCRSGPCSNRRLRPIRGAQRGWNRRAPSAHPARLGPRRHAFGCWRHRPRRRRRDCVAANGAAHRQPHRDNRNCRHRGRAVQCRRRRRRRPLAAGRASRRRPGGAIAARSAIRLA